MIEIRNKTKEKCDGCDEFCPDIQHVKLFGDGKVVNIAELHCKHQEFCDGLEKHLKKIGGGVG